MPVFDLTLLCAVLVALVAGTVRGFSGFGGALIFVPLVSALYDPARAGPTLLIVDVLLSIPMTLRAFSQCSWREVAPMAFTAATVTPLGVYALSVAEPVALRWGISAAVAVILAVLASGLRYQTRAGLLPTMAVGTVSGFMGGAAQLSGAPVAAFWLGGPGERTTIRANLIVFFALVSVASALSLGQAGLFTGEVGRLALWLGPFYGLGVAIGGRRFVGATEAGYRRTAYAVIAIAALFSAPLWDGSWR